MPSDHKLTITAEVLHTIRVTADRFYVSDGASGGLVRISGEALISGTRPPWARTQSMAERMDEAIMAAKLRCDEAYDTYVELVSPPKSEPRFCEYCGHNTLLAPPHYPSCPSYRGL